ncbi:MAG: Acetyl-coenzyme A carboxylase carboxyl transferase subunit alpha [Chlamydiia bacterium]|nr:Acetyl-coenzyme A carboxylase carboxyl transferase subunit alpha [Chlamydiia bacterium]
MLEHEKEIVEYEKLLEQLKEQGQTKGLFADEEILQLEEKLSGLKEKVYSAITPWERIQICRHPNRPHSLDYIKEMCSEFVEIFGDRQYRDDAAIIGGFGIIGGERFVIIAQEKGSDTATRIERNFGMPHPEGYRKAKRIMKIAEKFQLPVLSLIDTAGAFPGLEAEERGQGGAIAENLLEMARLQTPIIVVLIGEGCSGGALGMGMGDVIGMLEHAYYSVISPEGCASILWKDKGMNSVAADSLKMHAEFLLEEGVIDAVIQEPVGGAHHDQKAAIESVKHFVLEKWKYLSSLSIDEVLDMRYEKFRRLGHCETVGQ